MLNNKMVSVLKDALVKKKIISIFSDPSMPDLCAVGFALAISSKHIIISQISVNGMYDGYSARMIDSIFRIDYDGAYEKKIKFLYSLQKQKHLNIINKTINKTSNLYKELLLEALKNKMVVAINTVNNDETVFGWVNDIKSNIITIDRINNDGASDGVSILLLENIEKIYCDSEDEHTLGILNSHKK